MSNPIGLRNLHYALLEEDSTTAIRYGLPQPLVGAINAKISPTSNQELQYADDGPFDVMNSLGDISVELELASLPLQSQAILLGHTYANGVITMADTDIPPYLAIGFMSRATNGRYRFVWIYKGKFALSDTEYSTITDKPTFKSQTIKGTFMKRDNDGNWQSVADSGDVGFVQATADNWFTSVGGISPGVATIAVSASAVVGGKTTLTINGLRHGDYAYFKSNATSQKEGVDTMSLTSEFILSTLAAISQEESRSLSENTLWGVKKRFERGEVRWSKLLGYNAEKVDGKLVITIDEDGASTVREIYCLALNGIKYTDIARVLVSNGTLTIRGDTNWTRHLVKGILTNERYTGDVLCQKTYTQNYLTHRSITNRGEKPQYLIENHHPAIISKADFKAVNPPITDEPRSRVIHAPNILAKRVLCGECGKTLSRYNSNGTHAKWCCPRRNLSRKLCDGHRVYESDIEKAVHMAFLEKYTINGVQDIYGLLAQLKHLHEYDNVERERSILRREISIAAQREISGTERFGSETSSTEIIGQHSLAITLTQQLEAKERFWKLIEEDWQLRVECIKWMEGLPQGGACIRAFVGELDTKRLRAWAVSITVLAPISYEVTWLDGSKTTVTLDEVENDHRLADWRE